MDENTEKFHQLGVILLLDIPKGIHIGIDNTIWRVSDKFKGIKMIPLGSHYIHYTLESENNMFKLGFFIHVSPKKRIYVKKWSNESQDFLALQHEDEERYIQGVETYQFDAYLGPYPQEKYEVWLECSNFISKEVLEQLNPLEKRMYQIDQEYNNQEKAESNEDFKVMAGTIYYTDIQSKYNKFGLNGENLTQMNLDKSHLLEKYLQEKSWEFLLGELQYSFIMFIIGEDFTSLEQWKKVFILIIQSDSYMEKNPEFFVNCIPVLYNVLKQFPKDFFLDCITKDNFLSIALSEFIQNGIEQQKSKRLATRMNKLKEMLNQHFLFFPKKEVVQNEIGKYEFDIKDDENLPQIVDIENTNYF